MSVLYETIMDLCEKRKITGYRLCKDVGISASVITDLKMGRKEGRAARNADKIASYFGVSVGYLLGTEDEKKPAAEIGDELSEREREVIQLLRRLPPEQQDLVIQVAENADRANK